MWCGALRRCVWFFKRKGSPSTELIYPVKRVSLKLDVCYVFRKHIISPSSLLSYCNFHRAQKNFTGYFHTHSMLEQVFSGNKPESSSEAEKEYGRRRGVHAYNHHQQCDNNVMKLYYRNIFFSSYNKHFHAFFGVFFCICSWCGCVV